MMREYLYSAAAYLRLSREDNANGAGVGIGGSVKTESNSISSQRELIRSYIRQQDDMELFDIYVDGSDKIGLNQKGPYGRGR